MRSSVRLLIAAALVTGIGIGGCVSTRLDPIPDRIRVYRPERHEESELWVAAAEFDRVVADAGLLYEEEALKEYLDGVLARLQAAGGTQHIVRVFVIRHPHRNAFALPNGSLYLHSGMVTALENEAQLATVLAHELAHFQGRHSARDLFADQNRGRAKTALRVLLGAATAAAGDPRLGIALADGVSGTTRALVAMTIGGYSKRLEREADQVGLERVAAAGYQIAEAQAVFEHLKQELDEAGVEEPGLFGTHPRLDARIESARAFFAEWPAAASGDVGADVHQAAIQRIALLNAELDLAIGRLVFARAAVERHLHHDPRSAAGTTLLGEIQRRSGDADELARSAQSFARAAALDPASAAPERALGLLYRRRGDHDRATQHFARALARDPGIPDAELLHWYQDNKAAAPSPRDERERWVVWPVASTEPVAKATHGRTAVDALLLEELAARKIDAIPAGDAVTLWEDFQGRLFATVGPETEAVVDEKSKLLHVHFRNEIATRFRHDAFLLPNIQMVGAPFVQGFAEWCGVSQGIADRESGYWRKLNASNYNGTTKALCLVNELTDPEGVEIGTGVGGLELYAVFSEGRFRDLELSELFQDGERNRRAVTLALGPLTAPPPGTVLPSDDPACQSAAYRPWAEQDKRCQPKRVGEEGDAAKK